MFWDQMMRKITYLIQELSVSWQCKAPILIFCADKFSIMALIFHVKNASLDIKHFDSQQFCIAKRIDLIPDDARIFGGVGKIADLLETCLVDTYFTWGFGNVDTQFVGASPNQVYSVSMR